MRVCVIGGTGHIGCNLVEMFVQDGWQITVVTSGRTPIPDRPPWRRVKSVTHTYQQADPSWPKLLADQKPDVLIDIVGTDVPATYEAAKARSAHLIACGSVWMFGPSKLVPTPEITQGPCEFAGYARRYAELNATLGRAAADGLPFTAIMPPNICGPGKIPLDLLGGRSIEAHKAHKKGQPVTMPDGPDALIGPCDAEDVARAFFLAAKHTGAAAGQIFNVGSAYALSTTQLVETYARIYDTTIPIRRVPADQFATKVLPDRGANYHFLVHMCPDITKIRTLLDYHPHYSPERTLSRAIDWMRARHLL